ncbi:uncharacterized protein LOC132555686 [Ylistrum balloti]|uniref:uncharacterized protein LOC132555686 n=1 Tax=Ylistrum balloti TaxID=509963 RepID=UPI002905C828|nr:uncharacterized protein LOC132555686 [Ylistrum balloti]
MKLILALLGFAVTTQAYLRRDLTTGHYCLACCGPASHGCCNDCGLSEFGHHHLDELAVSKRKVLSTKSFIDDLNAGLHGLIPQFSGPDSACLDCCGNYPCCGDCGIDSSIFGHTYPDIPVIGSSFGHHGSTPEPHSPEEGSYGTGTDDLFGGLNPIYHGSMGIHPEHAYYDTDN